MQLCSSFGQEPKRFALATVSPVCGRGKICLDEVTEAFSANQVLLISGVADEGLGSSNPLRGFHD